MKTFFWGNELWIFSIIHPQAGFNLEPSVCLYLNLRWRLSPLSHHSWIKILYGWISDPSVLFYGVRSEIDLGVCLSEHKHQSFFFMLLPAFLRFRLAWKLRLINSSSGTHCLNNLYIISACLYLIIWSGRALLVILWT